MENKIKKIWFIPFVLLISIFFWLFINFSFSGSDNSFVTLKVLPLHVTIWSSGDIALPTIQPSFDTWEIQATFTTDSFRLDDRKTSDEWYITTIQASDLIFDNWSEEIRLPNENIRFKTTASPSVIYWLSNPRVTFWTSIKNTWWNIWSPVVYFKRESWTNSWVMWRYGDTPSIKIIIPLAQAPGTYTWIIYFTLISW